MFQLYIDAVSIINCKAGSDGSSGTGIEFSIKDYYAIQVSLILVIIKFIVFIYFYYNIMYYGIQKLKILQNTFYFNVIILTKI